MAIVTADEARQKIANDPSINPQRKIPPTLLLITRMMQENAVYACNVGPWAHVIDRPSAFLMIPPYVAEEDKEGLGYARSSPFPAIHRFAKIVDEYEMSWCEDDGRKVVLDMIGVGFGMPRLQSIVRQGVFVPEGRNPTKAELAAARKELDLYLDELIAEARDAYDAGPRERNAVITPLSRHVQAARLKGINEPWVHHQTSQQSLQCEMCGTFNPKGVAKCKCGTILDFELYQKIEKRQAEMFDRVKGVTLRNKPAPDQS